MNHFAVHLKLTRYCKLTIFHYKIKIKLKEKNPMQDVGRGSPGHMLNNAKLHKETIHSPIWGRRPHTEPTCAAAKAAGLREKTLSVPSHQRTANQNHNEDHLTPVRMAIIIRKSTENSLVVREYGFSPWLEN